jgi:hypothetical protein
MGICIVIKGKGLRGEQFVSLSKQKGEFGEHRFVVAVVAKVRNGTGRGKFTLEGSTMSFTCQDPVLDDIHSNGAQSRVAAPDAGISLSRSMNGVGQK